ncbi:MAG: sensor domain-containing diguanylate cyclase [Kangiellaceae bacterium]|nr:sensor domain-containing diguanylate cyclase [Kangiellaceae bacterium]
MPKGNLVLVPDSEMPPINEADANRLVKVQRDILKLIVTSDDFQHAFDSLCKTAEGIVADSVASIMFYRESGDALEVRSSPHLPLEAIEMVNGLVPGAQSASCGTAVFKQKPQYITDTSTDERWKEHQDLVNNLNIHACWSMPICDADGQAIGSFALSSFEKRAPSDFQMNLLQTSAFLAGLILQREIDHKALYNAAHYDHLTKLPNRFLFNIQAEQAIARANRIKAPLSLFYIDLDKFKVLNDELGHEAGDEALTRVADRMSSNIRREDLLTRIGGDEFILMVESARSRHELTLIAEKLISALREPFIIQDKKWKINACIGISSYPTDGMNVDDLVRKADKAMYAAKSDPNSKVQFYSN